jgi:hypothetical protein
MFRVGDLYCRLALPYVPMLFLSRLKDHIEVASSYGRDITQRAPGLCLPSK